MYLVPYVVSEHAFQAPCEYVVYLLYTTVDNGIQL